MNTFLQSLKNLFLNASASGDELDERYLAESVDIYDLERRMRHIDAGRPNFYSLGAYGVLSR